MRGRRGVGTKNNRNGNTTSDHNRSSTSTKFKTGDDIGGESSEIIGNGSNNNGSTNSTMQHTRDKCRNASTPCSSALRDIMCDIFPEIGVNKERRQSISSEGDVNTNANANTNGNSVSDAVTCSKQSLLGQIIRKSIVEERQRQIHNNNDGSTSTASTGTAGIGSSVPSSSSQTKKKRKKKKKNKSSTACTAGTGEGSGGGMSTEAQSNRQHANHHEQSQLTPTTLPVTDSSSSSATPSSSLTNNNLTKKKIKKKNKKVDVQDKKINEFLDTVIINPTTTQNDSNIVVIAPPPPNRDLSSLLDYIQFRYREYKATTTTTTTTQSKNQSKQQQKKNHQNNASLSSSSHIEETIIPTIPYQRLHAICKNIQCRSCEGSALSSLKLPSSSSNINNDNKIPFVLNPASIALPKEEVQQPQPPIGRRKNELAIPVIGKRSLDVNQQPEEDGGSAFDYVAMEEGYDPHTTTTSSQQQEQQQESKENNSNQSDVIEKGPHLELTFTRGNKDELLIQLKQPEEDADEEVKKSFPFSARDIDELVKNIMMPCGLYELESLGLPTVEERGAMRKEFVSVLKSFSDKIHGLLEQITDLTGRLHDESLSSTKSFDVRASTAFIECDKKTGVFLESFGDLLSSLHCVTSHARTTVHSQQRWITDVMNKLWEKYEVAIKSLVDPTLHYKWKVIHTESSSNRQSSVPPLHNNAVRRKHCQEMLDRKIDVFSKLNDELDSLLLASSKPDEESLEDTRNLSHIVALAVYFSHQCTKEGSSSVDILTTNASDYKQILETRRALFSEVSLIGGATMQNIKENESKQKEALRNQIRLLDEQLQVERTNVTTVELPKSYEQSLMANQIFIEELTEKLEETDSKEKINTHLEMEQEEMHDLCETVKYLVEQQRLLEDIKTADIHKYGEHGSKSKIIPQWFQKLISSNHEEFDNKSQKKCNGGSGERRVVSIIATCFYDWLQDRCMEWHADLTQKELLSIMEEEDDSFPLTSGKQSTKGKKKSSKKKRNRKKSDAKKEAKVDVVKVETSEKLNETKSKPINDSDCTRETSGGTVTTVSAYFSASTIEGNNTNCTDVAMPKETDQESDEESVAFDREATTQDTTDERDKPCYTTESPNVGVEDGHKFIPTEDYLINRYLQLEAFDDENVVLL